MIDFISTNPTAHPQTVACARLLSAVISQAIEDASSESVTDAENFAAIEWLFSKQSSFDDYARLIGGDADQIRSALLEPASDVETKNSRFDRRKRRYLKASYLRWLERRTVEKSILNQVANK